MDRDEDGQDDLLDRQTQKEVCDGTWGWLVSTGLTCQFFLSHLLLRHERTNPDLSSGEEMRARTLQGRI